MGLRTVKKKGLIGAVALVTLAGLAIFLAIHMNQAFAPDYKRLEAYTDRDDRARGNPTPGPTALGF